MRFSVGSLHCLLGTRLQTRRKSNEFLKKRSCFLCRTSGNISFKPGTEHEKKPEPANGKEISYSGLMDGLYLEPRSAYNKTYVTTSFEPGQN